MKNTSLSYKEQIDKLGRNRSYVRVIFQQIDVAAADDGESTDNGHLPYSEWVSPDANYTPPATYATLERDRWKLDGTQRILPVTAPYEPEGYVGNEISDENGHYAVNPLITREFAAKHSILGLTITFDGVTGDTMEHIIVRYYNDGVLIDSAEVQGITEPQVIVDLPRLVIDKYTIECIKSSKPYRRARIQRIIHGFEKVFDFDDIEFTEQVSDVDPISRRLPLETLTFTVFDLEQEYSPDNPRGYWEFIDTQSPISVQHGYQLDNGKIEWLAPDTYLLDGRPEVDNNRASFRATKLTGHLTGIYYKGKSGQKSLYDLAEDVLLDAGLTATEYWIDPSLKDIYTRAALPIDTHKNCLQLIAHAGMCKVYTDASGATRIEKMVIPAVPEDVSIDFNAAYEKPVVTKIAPLYSINVLKHTYSVADTATELHKSTFSVTGATEFYAEFQTAEETNVAITGGTLSDVQIYARAVTATITASGEVTLTITGKLVAVSTSGMPLVVSTDARGEEEVIANPLVTEDSVKGALEAHIADYLMLRNAYALNYRGRPDIEAGDLISLQSQFTPTFPALVLRHVLAFNGALSGSGIFKKVG